MTKNNIQIEFNKTDDVETRAKNILLYCGLSFSDAELYLRVRTDLIEVLKIYNDLDATN